jgi:hypothetical protein
MPARDGKKSSKEFLLPLPKATTHLGSISYQ